MADEQTKQQNNSNPSSNNFKLPGPLSGIGGQTKNLAENYIKNKTEMIAKQALKKGLQKAAMTPQFWIGIAIVLGIVILVALFLMTIATITGQNNSSTTASVNAQPGPPPTTNSSIISWAQQIDDSVTKLACSSYRNVMLATITNGSHTVPQKYGTCSGDGYNAFLCTDLVIQSYTLAGVSKYFNRKAYVMAEHWIPSVQLITGENVFSLISPVDAIFPSCDTTTNEIGHAALIENVSVNSNGAGTITTIDTNMPSEYNTLRVRGWNITTPESITCGVLNSTGIARYFWLGQIQ